MTDTDSIDLAARERERLFQDRWSGDELTGGIIRVSGRLSAADLKRYSVLETYDDDFLETLTPDIRIAEWRAGSVLFEEGSDLDLAVYVIEGEVETCVAGNQDESASPIFDVTRIPQGSSPSPTVLDIQIDRNVPASLDQITLLSAMDFDLPFGHSVRLGRGEFFGEIGALNGWPQSVTARVSADAKLMQIRVPAMRQMKKKSPALNDHIDKIYRKRSLHAQLASTPLLRGAPVELYNQLAEKVAFVSCAPGEVICREGEPADALYLVRSGFLKISKSVGTGDVVLTYLSKGMTFGEVELLVDGLDGWQSTTTSVGYSELVKIDRGDFLKISEGHSPIPARLWENAVTKIKDTGSGELKLGRSELIDFSLAKGLVQGNSILVIDLNTCTRCDDCVQACAETHGGRPRFVREGEKFDNFLVARSCYHCEDPVCLIGCPTGAIRRANVGDVVEIDDNLCIGCGNCAQKCPYDAIIMHETGTSWPDDALPEYLSGRDRKVASKCDLCHTSSAGPACVNNCPHGCVFRVAGLDEFQELLASRQGEA